MSSNILLDFTIPTIEIAIKIHRNVIIFEAVIEYNYKQIGHSDDSMLIMYS